MCSVGVSKLKQRGLEESNINDAAFLQDALIVAKENVETFELHLNRIGGFRVDVIQTGDAPRFEIEIMMKVNFNMCCSSHVVVTCKKSSLE